MGGRLPFSINHMNERELEIRKKLKIDFAHYASKCLKIRTKEGAVEPFTLNKAQLYIHERLEEQKAKTGKVRAIILKGRQQGCSTYIEGRLYHRVTHSFGIRAFILTHDQEATNNLFEMAQRYHEYCPQLVRPETTASNAKELNFGALDSGYKVGTAGNKAVGRSSTVQLFHGSEVAFWPHAEEHAKGILQAVPDLPGTEVILESTANGLGNFYHQQWQKAERDETEYQAVFVPWYWQDEYQKDTPEDFKLTDDEKAIKEQYKLSDAQLYWRRNKIAELSVNGIDGEKAFKQEYPCTAAEAFQTTGEDCFITPDLVMTARKGVAEQYGAKVIGVDPARFGDDRTSIIRRQGRVAYQLESYAKKDTMEVAGLVHLIIENEKPDRVFIDVGGLGAGVVDRLNEMGYRKIITAVNSGERPLDAKSYFNKRAEMWGLMKAWLKEHPVQIPDTDTLHADLCAPTYKYDSNTRIQLEKKEGIKKRGLKSPDEADALALTFAFPVSKVKNEINYPKNQGIV
jgi:hypothetical protein